MAGRGGRVEGVDDGKDVEDEEEGEMEGMKGDDLTLVGTPTLASFSAVGLGISGARRRPWPAAFPFPSHQPLPGPRLNEPPLVLDPTATLPSDPNRAPCSP